MKTHIINPKKYSDKELKSIKKQFLKDTERKNIIITSINECEWKPISDNKEYVVQRYLYKNNMVKCLRKFTEFKEPRLIKESGGYYHFICKDGYIFTCTLKNN